ncbi:DNA-formamidopyrimidine glycosylase family protein [Pedobacter sp. AW1-32]|uniref:DNA-formamidopyrimidine glycosylase family protein n=1 Tax=Pedobacter sp. AW1-32 TaxID=3383026 RepID=UPI003FF017BD
MPELPDLAVMAKNLSVKLVNHTVKGLTLHVDRKNNVPEGEMQDALVGHKVKSIVRVGKELHLNIGDHVLGLHLMLHGEIRLVASGEEVKFPIIQLDFPSHTLYLTDWQKSATPTLDPEPSDVIDALDVEADWFVGVLSKKKTDIKTVLLDQKIIRGIGNTYADEILYHAGISPLSTANAIPVAEVKKLVKSIHSVLLTEIDNISKVDPDRITGENKDFLKIHLPKTKETAKGEEILIDKKGSRKSYYVAGQKLYS